MKRQIVIWILLVGLASGAFAFPFANYGNVRVPDAYVMPHTMAKFTMMNYLYPENNRSDDDTAYNWGTALNIGVLDYGEIGLVYTGDEIFYAHLKGRILRETLSLPDVVIGIDKLFSDVESKYPDARRADIIDSGNYRRNTLYLAVSKTTLLGGIPIVDQLPTRLTIGIGTHRFQGTVDFSEQFAGLFGAAQFEVMPNFAVIGEVDGHNLNTAFEYRHENFSGKLMLYKIEEWGRRDAKFGFTLSYIFDRFVADEDRGRFSPFAEIGATLVDDRETAALDELQRIRRQRERAEQELEEIRRILQE